MLFSKQARRYIALDESSPVVSQTSGDEEYQPDVFIENRREELLQWTFKSEIDRKLILGIIDRSVELDAEWDADTIKPEDMKRNSMYAAPFRPNMDIHRESITKKQQKIIDEAERIINNETAIADEAPNVSIQNELIDKNT